MNSLPQEVVDFLIIDHSPLYCGFIFAFFGLAILIYVIVLYLLVGSPVQGFPFLASIIAIFSGVQLLAIGIIGEYLARIHFRTMDKPQYVELDVEEGN